MCTSTLYSIELPPALLTKDTVSCISKCKCQRTYHWCACMRRGRKCTAMHVHVSTLSRESVALHNARCCTLSVQKTRKEAQCCRVVWTYLAVIMYLPWFWHPHLWRSVLGHPFDLSANLKFEREERKEPTRSGSPRPRKLSITTSPYPSTRSRGKRPAI